MSSHKFLKLNPKAPTETSKYIDKYSLNEPEILRKIREVTVTEFPKWSIMLATPIQVQLMRLMMQSIHAKKCIEIGVFTGYNTVSTALALPKDGKVIGCDISEEFVNPGRKLWEKEGLGDLIDIRFGPADDTLSQLIADGQSGTFDCCFIDADKSSYDSYYEKCLQLLRQDGILFIDNMFWCKQVLKPEEEMDESTKCIFELTKKIRGDKRVDGVLLDISDGLIICRKL